jgi:hypothetical protein
MLRKMPVGIRADGGCGWNVKPGPPCPGERGKLFTDNFRKQCPIVVERYEVFHGDSG